jgi:hypothetical protein
MRLPYCCNNTSRGCVMGVDLLIYDSYGSTSRWLRHP